MPNTAAPRKSAWIPWVFVAAMGLVVVVNGLLAYFALSTWPGIATENHYRKGIAYNETLQGATRQAALGWSVAVALTPETTGASAPTPGPFQLTVHYRGADGHALSGLRVRAHLIRPVQEGYDRTVDLIEGVSGVYQGRIQMPLAGQWDVVLAALDGAGNHHQWRERVQVP